MSSVSAFLDKRPNSKNLHPITIRIIKDRKSSYLYTGQSIKLNQWDKKNRCVKNTHPNASEINQFIFKKVSLANKSLLEAEIGNEYLSPQEIKNRMIANDFNDFFIVSKIYLDNIKQRERFHQFDVEVKRVEVFKEFLGKDKLFFNELNLELVKNFETFLIHTRNISRRTVANYMISIRTIFNLAISRNLTKSEFYPFGKGKYQIKFPETQKIGLTIDEIQSLEVIKDVTKAQQYALHVWLLSFYFAGIRIGDVLQLKWSDIQDNRLHYRMGKNNKLVSLKVPEKASVILNTLNKHDGSMFIFKELEGIDINNKRLLRTRIKTATRNFNRRLEIVAEKAGIDKKISMHIARHSFGNISGDRIPVQLLQKLYRHSSITTTMMYQSHFMRKEVDNALDEVINF